MIELKELSTGMLIKLLGMKEVNIIDVRPIDAYNGWKLKDEARGGHIQGAKSLPIKWADYIDSDTTVILYGKYMDPDNDDEFPGSAAGHIGEVSGYNYIEPKGRIPGAVFASCGSDAYHMENYRNVDHTTREFHETAKIWKESDITPDKHLAFYCGTGWRGSEAWINAWLMGWPRVSVFDGGWFEWSSDPDNPFQTGIPDKS